MYLASVDFMGGNPTDTGANLANADGPPNLRYIARAPRRGRKAPGGGGSSVNVTPAALALTLTGHAPTILTPRTVTPGALALTLTGHAPTVLTPRTVTPGALGLTLTGHAPTVLTPITATPGTLALTWTGHVPTVTAGASVSVTPDPLALTWTGHAPTVTGTAPDTDTDAGPVTAGAKGDRRHPPHQPTYRVFDTYSSKPSVQQSAQAVEQEQARVRKVANRRAAILAAVMAACEDDYLG
jgi:hypothetical protein